SPQLPLILQDLSEGVETVAAEQLILAAGLGYVGGVGLAGLETGPQNPPSGVGLAQGSLLSVQVPVGAVEVPVRNFNVGDHLLHEPFKVGPRLVEAQPGHQDA